MEITCPKCSKETTFNVTDTISCSHCQTSFNKIKFAKKAMITAWSALAIGGFAGHKIDDFLEPNRYAVAVEYALIESCVKGGMNIGYQRLATAKFGICACALEKTQKTIDFKRYNDTPSEFWTTMRASTLGCTSK